MMYQLATEKLIKKNCICILNLLELKKVLQDYYKKIRRNMYLSDKNNLKKDKNVQIYS